MRERLALPFGFVFAFAISGLAVWPLPYSQVSLPNTLFGYPLWAVFFSALLSRAFSKSGWLPPALVVGVAPLMAVYARVLVETSQDPTSHNLWPIALFLTGTMTFPVAASGSALVSFYQAIRGKFGKTDINEDS
ncbi:MAG: hypothetical protein IAE97_00720 [Chthoniobacterales bacterium]|nr:hypothetical protein [Chthoniobacterales bacterium]